MKCNQWLNQKQETGHCLDERFAPTGRKYAFEEYPYFLPVGANLSPRQYPSLLLLIQPLIVLHLLQNPTYAQHYDDSRFSILAQSRFTFHLSALEATFIKTSNSTILLDKGQTKRFEDMNILIRAILKFCTTNHLFKTKTKKTKKIKLRLKLMLVGLQPISLLNVLRMSSKSSYVTPCHFKKSKLLFKKTIC